MAPEYSHYVRDMQKGTSTITDDADIWSMGCVFSEALVWSVLGPSGQSRYNDCRTAMVANISAMRDSGYDASFHDGVDRLIAVDQMHRRVLESRKDFDSISTGIVGMIESSMMCRKDQRLLARQLYGKFQQVLEEQPT